MSATVTPIQYIVSSLPESVPHRLRRPMSITVEWREDGYIVYHGLQRLSQEGEWVDGYYESCGGRWSLEDALRLAEEHAPHVTVNGYTVEDTLRMARQSSTGTTGDFDPELCYVSQLRAGDVIATYPDAPSISGKVVDNPAREHQGNINSQLVTFTDGTAEWLHRALQIRVVERQP